MSEKDIQNIIDRTLKSNRSTALTKIVIGVAISVISISIITFFTSFYGVKSGVKNVTNEFIVFKADTKKNIEDMKVDITKNSNTNFSQEGEIKYLKGRSERGIKLNGRI